MERKRSRKSGFHRKNQDNEYGDCAQCSDSMIYKQFKNLCDCDMVNGTTMLFSPILRRSGKDADMECPLCKCKKFYLKDPDDEYETYGFDCESGEACFDPGIDDDDVPELTGDSHIYCDTCSWSGKYGDIK